MRSRRTLFRRVTTGVLLSCLLLTSAAACEDDTDTTGATADSRTYSLWDPYTQFTPGSGWPRLVQQCGRQSGVKIRRTGFETTQLTDKALLAAQQGHPPDVLVVDNPDVSNLAEADALVDADEFGMSTTGMSANLLKAGRYQGKMYGIPVGANTLALCYNEAILDEAGVDPASVHDWASLNQALEKVARTGRMGITFSATSTEEGTFQFLPWFWGAGAELTRLDSPAAVRALSLWSSWLNKGYAPVAVINNSQSTAWEDFLTGDYAFVENGTWQMENARASGLRWGVIVLPGELGGIAPSPIGGEFITAPRQKDPGRYEITRSIISCLTQGENALAADTALTYIAAHPEVQDQQVAARPWLEPWVQAVRSAQGRTQEDLIGSRYREVSAALWTAVQAVLTEGRGPVPALAAAQARIQ